MKHSLLSTALFILFSQTFFSQTVTLDTTFGTGGRVTNPSITSGQTIQLQSDGKIVSCYLSDFSITGNVNLARFNSDGSVDTTFGTNGFVTTAVVNETGGINMMKIQADGKILITGSFSSNGSSNASYLDFCTARFNTDGSLDTSFGTNGYAITGFQGQSYDEAQAIAIQNDGKILVGGHSSQYYLSSSNYSPDFAIVRYLPNGLPDTSFGTNGKFTYNFGGTVIPNTSGYSSDFLSSITINAVGKIIAGGNTNVNESLEDYANFGFICLNANGALDVGFGASGQMVVDFGEKDYLGNVRLTADDKIIATGRHQYSIGGNNYTSIALVKLLADGNYDTSFGSNGMVLTNRDASNLLDVSNDLNIQSDGKIICFGTTPDATGATGNFLLVRLNTNGTMDTSFNGVGYKAVDFDTTSVTGDSFLIQNDGKLLCAGSITFSIGCLARVETDNLAIHSEATQSFSVFPNPFIDVLTVSSPTANFTNATAILYDVSGRKLAEYKLGEGTEYKFPVNNEIAKGNYFLKISDQGKTETLKIVKQ